MRCVCTPDQQAANRQRLKQLLLDDRFFVREDLNNPENRANLAFAQAWLVPGFKSRVCATWGLSSDARLVRLDWNHRGRPDFFIFSFQGDPLHPVESKCKAIVVEQVERYRDLSGLELRCITGDPLPSGYVGTTWSRIRDFACAAREETGPGDHRDALTFLDCAVRDVLGLLRRNVIPDVLRIPDDMPDDTFFRSVAAPLVELELSRPGCFRAKGVRRRSAGIILRLPNAITNGSGVSLVALEAKRPGYLNLPDAARLRSHLKAPLMPWVSRWEQVLARFPQAQPRGPGRVTLNVESGAVPAEVFTTAYADLVERVRLL